MSLVDNIGVETRENKVEALTSNQPSSLDYAPQTIVEKDESLKSMEEETPSLLSHDVSEEKSFASIKNETSYFSPDKDDADSAIGTSRSSPATSSMKVDSIPESITYSPKIEPKEKIRTLEKSSSAVTLRQGLKSQKGGRRIISSESWSENSDFAPGVIRTGSLSEKRASQPAVVDEWESKLYGHSPSKCTG